MRRHPNIVNLDEVDAWAAPGARPPPFGGSSKRLGQAAGAQRLGANYFSVPAGASAVPMHAHHNNEEALYILEGSGTLRIGNQRMQVRKGDFVALLCGPEHAHQLIADQGVALAYLCFSTANAVDVVTYPDSGKLLASAISPDGPPLRKMFRATDGNVGYWEGEGGPTGTP